MAVEGESGAYNVTSCVCMGACTYVCMQIACVYIHSIRTWFLIRQPPTNSDSRETDRALGLLLTELTYSVIVSDGNTLRHTASSAILP